MMMDMNSLPKYCVRRSNTIELRVEGILVLDTAIISCGIVDHHHHCSTHWNVRASECRSSTADAGSLDTGSAVGRNHNNSQSVHDVYIAIHYCNNSHQ